MYTRIDGIDEKKIHTPTGTETEIIVNVPAIPMYRLISRRSGNSVRDFHLSSTAKSAKVETVPTPLVLVEQLNRLARFRHNRTDDRSILTVFHFIFIISENH